MKHLPPILLLAALSALPSLHAGTTKKSGTPDPAIADTWIAAPKTYAGKKVTPFVAAYGDIGRVASNAAYAVVPITTCDASGNPGADIPVLVPPGRLKDFLAATTPKKSGVTGAFGTKVKYASFTATFVVIEGEPALVVGDVAGAKGTAPSVLLARQLATVNTATAGDVPAAPAHIR